MLVIVRKLSSALALMMLIAVESPIVVAGQDVGVQAQDTLFVVVDIDLQSDLGAAFAVSDGENTIRSFTVQGPSLQLVFPKGTPIGFNTIGVDSVRAQLGSDFSELTLAGDYDILMPSTEGEATLRVYDAEISFSETGSSQVLRPRLTPLPDVSNRRQIR